MMNDDAVHTIYTLKKLNSDDDDDNAKLSQLTEGRSTRKLLKTFFFIFTHIAGHLMLN